MIAPSLRRRLLALVLSLVGAVWLATAALTFFDVRHELDELLDGHLAQAAALLVVQQAAHFDDEDEEAPEAPLLHPYAPKVAFQVFHEGRLVRRSANAPVQAMVGPGRPRRGGFATVRLGGEPWRVFAAQGAERDVQVLVGESLHSRGAILWAVLRGTLWPLAVGLPLLALAVWWAVHGGLRPLRRLGRELASRPPTALSPVSIDGTPAEMRPMLDALNGLFVRIGALIEGERRFTADAAHELRTPIAAVRAQAQVALGAGDDTERRHALQQLIAGCDRATRLVEQLLVLARLESVGEAGQDGCDVVAVARGLLAGLAPTAAARGQTVGLDAPPACRWPVSETLLQVLLRNLLDNALRYSPSGAELRVTIDGEGALAVEDSGPGLDAAAIARLGQRFFRADPAGAPGSGLGWSIVRRIAEHEHLALQVDRSPALRGLRVQLRPAQNS
jgi:two-component system sensor histidine kinase QseC